MKRFITVFLLALSFCSSAQTITGSVSDGTTNEKIVGASIKLLGTDKGAVTDAEGKFSLEGTGAIQVSFVGYKTFEMK